MPSEFLLRYSFPALIFLEGLILLKIHNYKNIFYSDQCQNDILLLNNVFSNMVGNNFALIYYNI